MSLLILVDVMDQIEDKEEELCIMNFGVGDNENWKSSGLKFIKQAIKYDQKEVRKYVFL